ncbi:MAG: DUF4011 domain-containing protein, partial [Corticimicrobacter sp.]|uniref:DUF4011 domain-containing protein n=1 Tax=Corticimicrobacter sp. TaxID=2678536 RepID=UPI0032DBE720
MQDITASDSLEHSDHLEKNALLVLKISIRTKINFASAQNSVSILRTLIIENTGDAPAKNVALNLRATPTVLREKNWYVDHISAHSSIVLGDLDTPLDTAILGGLNEAEIGQLEFTLKIGDEITAQKQCRIELLARDEWGGLSEMENILAAFVSPNQPQVARLLKDASRLLEAAGYSGSMDGYQSNDPQRTWMIAGAIWSAATGLGLTYAVPPASFEREGQKIRDPERIVSEGLATCLDSALLLAAAFEAAGLHTAILFAKGHAWVGVWLIKHDFGKLLEPDVITVRKAVVSREFVALESTLLTKRPSVGFEQAVAAGNEGLSESRETEFELAIDINRARAARIRPLASHQTPESNQNESETRAPADLPKPLNFGLLPGEAIDEAPSTALGRIERWQRKLLDLSLANKLLNFKDTKLSIPLLCPTVATLEDGLASGKTYRLLPLKDENAVAGRDLSAEQTREIEASLARDALDKIQIAIPLSAHDMSNRLTELYRKARSDIQEGGTNTLFLVAGFLRWKRPEDDERHYRAPLLLIPVKLERRSAQSEFRLTQLEDEVRINATLLEFLKRDFDLRIPELEGDLPHDENGLDIPRIFELMRRRVRDVSGFEVLEECALSTFSFAKYLMWKDLVDRTDSLRESPLVRHLVDSPSEPFAGAHTPMPHPRDMDRNHVPADILAPLPADSSQLAAVAAAATGRDFVLVGPPGTGKSQTITNIIADQLGRGRTILFVAEKAAALDVVQRRLERQGLGSAVLELHSNKADRKVVFQQLGRSWERATSQAQDNWVRVTDELRMTRDQLNDYVTQLHLPGTQGFSIYQAIGRAVGSHVPFTLQFDNKDCHDEESWRRLRNLAIELGQRHTIIADLLLDGALSLVPSGEWSYSWQDTLLNAAQRLKSALRELETAREAIADLLGCDYRNSEIRITLDSLPTPLLEQPAIDPVALQNLAELRSVLPTLAHILAECSTARQALSAQYEDQSLASIPLETLDLQWREAQTKFWPLSTLAQGKVRKLLQTYASGGSANPATDLTALRRLVTARTSLDSSPFTELSLFAGEASDPAALKLLLDQAEAYLQVESTLINAGISRSKLTELRPQLLLKNGGSFKPLLERLKLAQENFNKEQVSFASASGQSIDEEPTLEARLAALPSYSERLSDWLKWQSSKRQAQAVGLAPLVESLEAGIPLPDTGLAFESAYMSWWLKPAMDASPALRSFAHWEHDALIKQFRSLDQTMTELVSGEVLRRLGNELPTRDSVPRRSELGLLRHQLGLQRPTAAIRSLIADMPTTFTKLAPCVLMSPLSVAQYLPPGQAQFDLVIFDEASQISTWDAIGAIARGRQAIIVGDPKQLPPTHFFGRSDEGESGQEEVAEFEKDMPSILDEAGAAGIPTHLLSWHYRSRDEALIAFSNYHYY